MTIRLSDFVAALVLVSLVFYIFVAPFIVLAYMRVAGPQPFRGGAAWRDTLMTLTEKPAGSETAPPGVRSHRPTARGVAGERKLQTRLELGQAGIKPGHHLETVAKAAADVCGLDRDLAWSLARRESSGRHWAADGSVLRSSSDAWGMFQIKVGTARDVAENLDIMTPWGNAVAALCHFRRLLDKARGDERLALRWYHRGEYAKGPVPQATHDYATDIIEGSATN